MQKSPPGLDTIIRIDDVEIASGVSRSTIGRLLKKGQFPRPVKISANANGWFVSQIKAWQESLAPVGPEPEPEAEEKGPAPWGEEPLPRDDRVTARTSVTSPQPGAGQAKPSALRSARRRR